MEYIKLYNLETMKEYGVVPEAWAPFDEGLRNIFRDPVLTGIGKKYGKSAAQVALRWNLQRGVVVIPKSVHEERIREIARMAGGLQITDATLKAAQELIESAKRADETVEKN